mmetsp:Transcript_30853/g.45356  ORF Transcript_30853/g.45356 Transcript_30853/m.45356 type:complete len:223 (-) Transcript_30853:1091-1759(-)
MRDTLRTGNFAFLYRKVQYIGINLVDGIVHNQTERKEWYEANLRWVENQVDRNSDDIVSIIIVGNAGPSDDNDDFFAPLYAAVDRWGKMLLYIHESNNPWKLVHDLDVNKHVYVLAVEAGIWPPLKVQIDTMTGILHIDQKEWCTEHPSKTPTQSASLSKIPSPILSKAPTRNITNDQSLKPDETPTKTPNSKITANFKAKPRANKNKLIRCSNNNANHFTS